MAVEASINDNATRRRGTISNKYGFILGFVLGRMAAWLSKKHGWLQCTAMWKEQKTNRIRRIAGRGRQTCAVLLRAPKREMFVCNAVLVI